MLRTLAHLLAALSTRDQSKQKSQSTFQLYIELMCPINKKYYLYRCVLVMRVKITSQLNYTDMKKIKKYPMAFIYLMFLTQLISCSKNDSSPEKLVLNLKNQELQSFKYVVEGASQNFSIKVDSIVDKRPTIEECPNIYTTLKYVSVYLEIQSGNGKTDTLKLTRRMCLPKGDLMTSDVNFNKKCFNGFCLGLQNVTEKSMAIPIDIKNYSIKLLIFN